MGFDNNSQTCQNPHCYECQNLNSGYGYDGREYHYPNPDPSYDGYGPEYHYPNPGYGYDEPNSDYDYDDYGHGYDGSGYHYPNPGYEYHGYDPGYHKVKKTYGKKGLPQSAIRNINNALNNAKITVKGTIASEIYICKALINLNIQAHHARELLEYLEYRSPNFITRENQYNNTLKDVRKALGI